jgi:hypothetical protein
MTSILFVGAGRSPYNLAGTLIHSATHRVTKANPLRGKNLPLGGHRGIRRCAGPEGEGCRSQDGVARRASRERRRGRG